MEERDTAELLKEVDSGCHMAVSSFEQVEKFDLSHDLMNVLQKSEKCHREIEKEAEDMLRELGEDEKNPNPITRAMSWLTTEVKLNVKEDANQVAKLMMDGCNTGIQSISEAISKYPSASDKSVKLARKLIQSEENFMDEMKEYL